MAVKILPLKKFRLLKEWTKLFTITEDTVIAYAGVIYSNKNLPKDVLLHELVHLDQQKRHGLTTFTKKYLNDKKFRLEMEAEAYKAQLASIEDEGLRKAVLEDCIDGLTSGLYGEVSERKAREMITPKVKETKLDVNKLL